MTMDVFAAAGIGAVLGFRHAFEPDHMAAVTTIAGRHSRVWGAWRLAVAWSAGHSATLALAALLTIVTGLRLPARLWPAAELFVALMLVALGASVIVRFVRGRWHLHVHAHDGGPHLHLHSHRHGRSHAHVHPRGGVRWALGFGLLHGLAGSGAVLALFVVTAPTRATQWLCLGAFAAGTTLGMLTVSTLLWAMVRLASHQGAAWLTRLRLASAGASIVVGAAIALHSLRAVRG